MNEPTSLEIHNEPESHSQVTNVFNENRMTRSFLIAQYPDASTIRIHDSVDNLEFSQEPEIIDITNQAPMKPGLHGSLNSVAFLKFASDMLGNTISTKPLETVYKPKGQS